MLSVNLSPLEAPPTDAPADAPPQDDAPAIAQQSDIAKQAVTDLTPNPDLGHINGPGGNTYVAHCNHYNCFLQKTLRSKPSLDMDEVLVNTAGMIFFVEFVRAFDTSWSIEERLQYVEAFFKARGYGNPKVTDAASGTTITATSSHHSEGYRAKFGLQEDTQDFFLTGAIQGALMASFGCDVKVEQTTCMATGDDVNTWTIDRKDGRQDRLEEYLGRAKSVQRNRANIDALPKPDELPAPPVTTAVGNMTLVGDEEDGIIPAFNVQLTFIPSLYYNVCSQIFLDRLEESGMKRRLGRRLLKEAGHVCGFFTLGNILLSSEYALLRKAHFGTDVGEQTSITALFGVVNAFGWGYWTLDELSEETLTFSVHNSYEAFNYREYFGTDAPESTCPLHLGGGEAIMNALRDGNILNFGGRLNDDYVNGIFADSDGFTSDEIDCFATNDDHACRFHIRR